jgi:hypothetical protein
VKKLFLIFSGLLVCTALGAASLTISVKLPDGRPAKDVAVQVQRDSTAVVNTLLGKTDSKGNIKVIFDDSRGDLNNKGYGIYQFVIMPEGYKWETSGKYFWTGTDKTGTGALYDEPGNCKKTAGGCSDVRQDSGLALSVTLKNTEKITVMLVDQNDRPLIFTKADVGVYLGGPAGISVTAEPRRMATDKDGRFDIAAAGEYKYFIGIAGGEYFNPESECGGKMADVSLKAGLNTIKFKKLDEKEITVRVRDFDTQLPLQDACVNVGFKSCVKEASGGTRELCIGKTDKDGAFYTPQFRPEKLEKFGASKPGYHEEWLDIDSFIPGDEYEFELKKEDNY